MNILCTGPHTPGTAPVLGTGDHLVPGLLCDTCGQVYVIAVAGRSVIPRTIPNKALLTVIMPLVYPNAIQAAQILAGYV
jgi:hypothetical protein